MKKQEILNGIMRELEYIASEKPKDFFYAIDCYADDYDKDSIGALILKWNQLGFGNFDDIFPITTKMVSKLESINDGIERSKEVYANIISLAKDALAEIKDYASQE